MATIVIDGAPVEMDDPCALYQALYAVKLKILAGEHVEEIMLQSPVSREMMRVSAANMAQLDKELMRLSAACNAKTTGKRSRFAKRMRFC
jgi:hypothetical protein